VIDEGRYHQLATAAFKHLVTAADQADPDQLETDSTGDMVTLTASSGEKCIVNTQRAARQIWVAGKSQGIHFSYDDASGRWLDDKGKGLELFAFVKDVVRTISGVELDV
jgi:CyaY protein